jgi:hypothetical protein
MKRPLNLSHFLILFFLMIAYQFINNCQHEQTRKDISDLKAAIEAKR